MIRPALLLALLLLSACLPLTPAVAEKMTGTGLVAEGKIGDDHCRLIANDSKTREGAIKAGVLVRFDPKTKVCRIRVYGDTSNGSRINLSHAVDQTEAQMQGLKDFMQTLRDMGVDFSRLAGGGL